MSDRYDLLRLFAEEEAPAEAEPAEAPAEEPKEQPDAALMDRHWQGVDALYTRMEEEAAALQQLYPDFQLRQELEDPRFLGMLKSGIDMRSAFQALHQEEILPAAMQYAARMVEARLASSLRSTSERIPENGLNAMGAVTVSADASGMSREDFKRVCRMVEEGKRISFG